MADICSFCDKDAAKHPDILFVKHDKAVICEPCVDFAKQQMEMKRQSCKK